MLGLTLATVLQVSLMAPTSETYADAHRQTAKTGRPMVIMVGTDWCMPCQRMKNSVLPEVRKDGLLSRVSFAMVDADREQDLAKRLTGGGPVPQLVMYRKTSDGWKRRKLIGGQSVDTVEKFIKDGLTADAASKNEASKDETSKKTAKR